NKQPLGLFTASPQGISVARDVSAGNLITGPTFDGLINALYSLKTQYQGRAAWIFHRTIVALIAKLKDLEGRYVWQPSIQAGQPDLLLAKRLIMTEHAPSVVAPNAYVGMIGDYSYYWVADAQGFQVQRLDELYARTNQVGFIGRLESDAMPVLEE